MGDVSLSSREAAGEAASGEAASPAAEAVAALLEVLPRLKRLMSAQLGHGLLSPQQLHLLLAVCDLSQRHGDGAQPGELSRRCWLSSPAVTAAVDDLVEQGLAARAHGEKDRRKVFVRLTPAGELALRETRGAATATLASLLQGWDERRVRELAAMLRDLDRAVEDRLSTARE
ncbi:MAG TPA: MarR family transcriptional regulator [Chloroflexota bacterium]|nr:MarR family transcriptional regulator [Chloroflexota bacterium]